MNARLSKTAVQRMIGKPPRKAWEQWVEFGLVQGRKGDQAHQVQVLDAPPSVAQNRRHAQRKKPEEMVGIVEDLIRLLEGVEQGYRAGRHPDSKTERPTAKLLRALADELEG